MLGEVLPNLLQNVGQQIVVQMDGNFPSLVFRANNAQERLVGLHLASKENSRPNAPK